MTESSMDRLEILTCPPQEIIVAAAIILVQKATDVNGDQPHDTHDETDSAMHLTPKKSEDEHCNLPAVFLTLSPMTFSTPQADKNSCCRDATCSVCLSPLLSRSELIETRCKVLIWHLDFSESLILSCWCTFSSMFFTRSAFERPKVRRLNVRTAGRHWPLYSLRRTSFLRLWIPPSVREMPLLQDP